MPAYTHLKGQLASLASLEVGSLAASNKAPCRPFSQNIFAEYLVKTRSQAIVQTTQYMAANYRAADLTVFSDLDLQELPQ